MPQFLIEAPVGASRDGKQRMMKQIREAIDEAYGHFPDIRIWLREYPAENVAQDGKVGAEPVRPLCFLEAPELRSLDAKRKMNEARPTYFIARQHRRRGRRVPLPPLSRGATTLPRLTLVSPSEHQQTSCCA